MLTMTPVVRGGARFALAVVSAAMTVVAGASGVAHGQSMPLVQAIVPVALDSGVKDNPGADAAVVFSQVVHVPGAPWLRLAFDDAKLPGKSYVRVQSFEDGEEQMLDGVRLAEWQGTTAYFNGSTVLVELVADGGTEGCRVSLSRVVAGADQGGLTDRRVCDSFDNRAASTNARVARLLPILVPLPTCPGGMPCFDTNVGGCSGFIIDTPLADDANDRLMLTAGHCLEASGLNNAGGTLCTVAQFETIMDTNSLTCAVRHPPVAKQFVINAGRTRNSTPGGCSGNDWGVFTCFKNSVNKTVFQEQAAAFSLAAAAPANGSVITKIGYGADGPASQRFCGCVPGDASSVKNATQQTAVGAVQAPVGVDFVVKHNAHTCGGDSGCALIDNMGRIVAIHTGGGCNPQPSTPMNCGSAITNPNLVNGMAQVAASGTPRNDSCASALQVLAGTTAFSTVGATTDGPREVAVNNAGNDRIDNDVWFRFTASVPAALPAPAPATPTNVMISLCDADYDTRIAVYNDACPIGPNTAIVGNDDSTTCNSGMPSTRSQVVAPMVAGRSYLIRVGGYNNQTGRGTLNIGVNDDCDVYNVLFTSDFAQFPGSGRLFEGPNVVSTRGYTNTPAVLMDGGCGAGAVNMMNDAWYLFRAPTAGTYRFETCTPNAFDTCLAVYLFDNTGPGPAGPPWCRIVGARQGVNEDNCGGGGNTGSRLDLPLTAAQQYMVRLGSRGNNSGSAVISISHAPPANDLCANAAVIAVNTPTAFNNQGAGTDGPAATTCGAFNKDVWFRYTAGVNGTATADVCAPVTPVGLDTHVVIHANNCGAIAGNAIVCNNDSCGVQSRVSWPVTMGTSYLIRVGSWRSTEAGTGSLLVTESAAGPTNNNCAQALFVGEGAQSFSTVGATVDGPVPSVCPAGAAMAGVNANIERDIWYQYVSRRTGNLIVSTCDATFDDRMAGYLGCPAAGGLELGCGDDNCGAMNRHSRMNLPLAGTAAAPNTYMIRLGSYYNPGPPLPPPPPDIGAPTGTGTLTVRFLPNDTRAAAVMNAEALAGNGVNIFDNTGAATEALALSIPPCAVGSTINHDLFYFYFASTTGTTSMSVCAPFNNIITVFDFAAGGGAGADVACDSTNAACALGTQSTVMVPTVAGRQYRIRLGATAANSFGEGRLTISPAASIPDNNDCDNATTAYLGDTPFTTVGASTDGPNPVTCLTAGFNMNCGRDVWFVHTATATGTLTVDTCDATFDNRIVVYRDPVAPPLPNNPAPVCPVTVAMEVCGDDNCGTDGLRARAMVPVQAGRRYVIRIGGYHAAVAPLEAGYSTGTGTLKLRMLANDTCAGAIPIIEGRTVFSNIDANTDGNAHANCLFFANDQITGDLWYLFTAPAIGRLVADTQGSLFDTKLAVWDFPAGSVCPPAAATAPDSCNDDFAPPERWSRVGMNVTTGSRYLLRVGGFNGATGAGVLNVKLIRNDACARATTIGDGSHPFDTVGATQDGTATCGNSNTTPDVWYLYTATCTGDVVLSLCNSTHDTVVSMYTGGCGALAETMPGCNDDGFRAGCIGTRSHLEAPVTMGNQYHIRVSGFDGATGDGRLDVSCLAAGACCRGTTCAVSARSACTGANTSFAGAGVACNVAGNFTVPCCAADFNKSGVVSVQDLFDFLTAYFSNDPAADINGGGIGVQDLFDFLARFFAGC